MDMSATSSSDIRVQRGDVTVALSAAARERGLVAIDTETTGLDARSSRLCTAQAHVPGCGTEIIILDPSVSPSRLLTLLGAVDVVKVFHHAMFDLGFIRHTYGSPARAVTCTKVAAKLLWPSVNERHSLRGLTRYLLNVELDKSLRLSDWSQTTLTDDQLRYAATDAEILPPLFEALTEHLRIHSLIELAEACWQHIPTRVELNERLFDDVFTY